MLIDHDDWLVRNMEDGKFLEKFPNFQDISYKFDSFTGYLGRRYDYIVASDLCDYFEKGLEELTEEDIEEASEGYDFYKWLEENHKLGERYDL